MPKRGNNSLKQKARQLARREGITYSEALAQLAAPQPTFEVDARSANSAYTIEDAQRSIVRSLQPAIDLQQKLAWLLQPRIDLQRKLAESMRPTVELQRKLAQSVQPTLDLQQKLARSLQPRIDLQQKLAESMRPRIDLLSAVTRTAPAYSNRGN
ncbi:hypothetical protein [Streptomyces griseochromogenes]